MRTPRLVACATTAATLVLTPAATGAGKVCHLVVDVRNDQRDANYTQMVAPPGTDLDLVGGDVASNDQYVTALFRLATLRQPGTTEAGTGYRYMVRFSVGSSRDHEYAMVVTYGADGHDAWAEGHAHQGEIGPATAAIDPARREVRVTANAALFGVTKGKKISRIELTSASLRGLAGDYDPVPYEHDGIHNIVDRAETTTTYVAGTPSCVAPRP